MNEDSIKASSDLIRWLKMLALPNWAKTVLALVMLLILCSAMGLLVWGLFNARLEVISSAVAMLTVGLPVGLIVVALVFGDGGAGKLVELTNIVLTKEVPQAILSNLAANVGSTHYKHAKVEPALSGCIANYLICTDEYSTDKDTLLKTLTLEFKLELNVKKANVVIWVAIENGEDAPDSLADLQNYQHIVAGAIAEGYLQNAAPVTNVRPGYVGFVFIKHLGDDFLLNPGDRLYFSQDLAFFVRALLSIASRHG